MAESATETNTHEHSETATDQPKLLTDPESEAVPADEEETNSEAVPADEEEANSETVPVAEDEENSEVTLSDTEEPDLQKENGSEE